MKKSWLLAFPVAAGLGAAPVQAAILDARFSGTVASQSGTMTAVGSTLTGEFVFNTTTGSFVLFNIGGVPATPGYASSATLTPDGHSAFYRAQVSAVQMGGTVNSTFIVDLEGLTPFVQPVLPGSAVSLLTSSALSANLDLAGSTFGYSIGNANGTGLRAVSATLTSFSVAVPEPASVALVAAACAGLALRRRRA